MEVCRNKTINFSVNSNATHVSKIYKKLFYHFCNKPRSTCSYFFFRKYILTFSKSLYFSQKRKVSLLYSMFFKQFVLEIHFVFDLKKCILKGDNVFMKVSQGFVAKGSVSYSWGSALVRDYYPRESLIASQASAVIVKFPVI